YRRDLGWKQTSSGNRSQQRFYLGRDQDTAAIADRRLVQFWDALERYFKNEREGEECLWEAWSLGIAKQIADGLMVVVADIPQHIKDHMEAQALAGGEDQDGLMTVAGWHNQLKEYFGTICGIEMAGAQEAEEHQIKRGEFYLDLG